MSVTKVEIVNMALRLLGVERINDLTDNNKRAQVMSDLYDLCRREVLCDADWSFARKRQTISPLATTPTFGWDYEFNRPSDCLQILEEYNGEDYQAEGTLIMADVNALSLVFTKNETDTSKFSAGFNVALAHKLAHKACFSLINDKTKEDRLEKSYAEAIANARFQNSKENPPQDPEIESFTFDVRG